MPLLSLRTPTFLLIELQTKQRRTDQLRVIVHEHDGLEPDFLERI